MRLSERFGLGLYLVLHKTGLPLIDRKFHPMNLLFLLFAGACLKLIPSRNKLV